MQQLTRTEILRIKGTRHYKAGAAFSIGELEIGTNILLVPEPQNPHDKNAVAVLSVNRKMLGHISKEVAAKYQLLCLENKIIQVKVHSANTSDDHALFDIRIAVTHNLAQQSSKSNLAAPILPNSSGTYEISLQCGPTYIGATKNLKKRYAQHLHELQNNTHSNKVLQADFNISPLKNFTFTVLRETSTKAEAEYFESDEIISRLKKGNTLYNKTLDGQGTSITNSQSTNTISDVFEKIKISSNQPHVIKNKTSNKLHRSWLGIGNVSKSNSPLDNKQAVSTITQTDGGTYEGNFIDGVITGKGKYTSVDGDIYEGDLVDGEITGQGKYTFANGDTYVGNFYKGRRSGEGKFTRKK